MQKKFSLMIHFCIVAGAHMRIFSDNAYFNTFRMNGLCLHRGEQEKNKEQKEAVIAALVFPNSLCWRYGEVDFQNFSNEIGFNPNKPLVSLRRTIVAVVEAAGKIFRLMLFILTYPFYQGKHYKVVIKLEAFHLGRDFQCLFGYIAFLFNKTLGLYHIQESEFQKACYDQYDYARHQSPSAVDTNSESVYQNMMLQFSPGQSRAQIEQFFRNAVTIQKTKIQLNHQNNTNSFSEGNLLYLYDIAFQRFLKETEKSQQEPFPNGSLKTTYCPID